MILEYNPATSLASLALHNPHAVVKSVDYCSETQIYIVAVFTPWS